MFVSSNSYDCMFYINIWGPLGVEGSRTRLYRIDIDAVK